MGTSLCGVLAVDKRVVFLAVLVGVGEGNLDIFAFEVDDGVEGIVGHPVFQQVLQTVARQDAPAIVHDGQASIQVGIVAEHVFHDVIVKRILLEQRVVWFEVDVGAVFVLAVLRHIRL